MLPPVSLSAPDNVLKLIENVFFKVLARQKHPQSISNPTSWHHTDCLQNNFTFASKFRMTIFSGSEKISKISEHKMKSGAGVFVRYRIKSFSKDSINYISKQVSVVMKMSNFDRFY